jgi:hypothetical protein
VSDVELSVVEGVAFDRPATVRVLSVEDGQLALEAPKDDGKVQRVDFPRSLAGPIAAAVRDIVAEEEIEEVELAADGETIYVHPVTHPFGCDAMVENRARHPRGYAHQAQHVMLSYELAPQVADALDAVGETAA